MGFELSARFDFFVLFCFVWWCLAVRLHVVILQELLVRGACFTLLWVVGVLYFFCFYLFGFVKFDIEGRKGVWS
jgi:hypothetical protein